MKRMTRRFFGIACLAALAGCVQTASSDRGASGGLNIQAVEVQIGPQNARLEDRGVNIARAQVIDDFQNAIAREVGSASRSNGVPATVAVTITDMKLASMAERVVAQRSFVEGTVTVRGANGATLKGPSQIRGYAQDLPTFGAFGALTTEAAMDDYRSTVGGFAKAVNGFVFGD